MRRAFAFALLLAGCSAQSPAHITGGDSSLTFWKDVKPLMDAKCTMCHYDGGIAPFAMDDYQTVLSHVSEIDTAVSTRVMPPWLAKPGCNSYKADRSLSDDQIKLFNDWINGGANEGDPATYVAGAPNLTGALSRVDLSLTMKQAYTPQLSPDDYRCFILDWPYTTEDKYVTGFRADPGNKSIVHHVIAYLAKPADLASYTALDGQDGKPGYTCFGGPGGSQLSGGEWIGGWAPGAFGYDQPAGTGIKIPAGSKVILQVHYNTASTAAAPDTTSLDFKIDDKTNIQKEAFNIPWTDYEWVTGSKPMLIPKGSADTMHEYDFDVTTFLNYQTDNTFQAGKPFTVYSVNMHMHTHGTSGLVELRRADGTDECLLDVPRWDFHWQGAYGLTQPITYNPGDQIHLECHWNNAAGTNDLLWGEGTGDEMCLTGFYITQ